MTQSRKKKVLQQVESHRRQRTILTFVIAAVLIVIIVLAVVYLRPAPNPVNLPDYLSHCVTANLVIHAHPTLAITIKGQAQTLPVTFDAGCSQPIHTHDSTGLLHVESDQNVAYTLGDWFLLWGYWAHSTAIANFNSTLVLGNSASPGTGHTMTMTVNGSPDTNSTGFKDGNPNDWQSLIFPATAGTAADPCLAGNCEPFAIVITYT